MPPVDTTSIGYLAAVEDPPAPRSASAPRSAPAPGSAPAPQGPSAPRSASARIGRRLAVALLLSVAIGSLLLAVPPLQGVARQIEHMHLGWVVAAAALELASCLGFVVIFRLFFDELPAGTARELAWTEEGSGALLPGGGVGALAIGGWLLRRAGMSTRSVIDRSSALFFLTSAINVAALVGGAALFAVTRPDGSDELLRVAPPILGGVAAALAVLAIPIVVARNPSRDWPTWLVDLAAGITRARRSLRRPSWRLLGAFGYLGFDIAALGAAFAAAGRPIAAAPLILGYLIGYLANLIPIPGGFGVLEGGLAATLIAYGAPATQATAAVVVYHAIAFWIPSLGGLAGYVRLRRRLGDGSDVPAGPRRAHVPACALALRAHPIADQA
jgi:uncharacterized membrane protein YbhN (UPF0104 family)